MTLRGAGDLVADARGRCASARSVRGRRPGRDRLVLARRAGATAGRTPTGASARRASASMRAVSAMGSLTGRGPPLPASGGDMARRCTTATPRTTTAPSWWMQRQRQRHQRDQRRDAERGLRDDDQRQNERAARRRRVARLKDMEQRQREQHVGAEAMIELHGQRVLEQVAPPRRLKQQARRKQVPVHQRPGVEREPGIEAGDNAAEEDLNERQHDDGRGDAANRMRRRRRHRGRERPPHPKDVA